MPLFRRPVEDGEVTAAPEPAAASPQPGRHDGPRCYVCQDEYVPNRDGTFTRVREAGWHYSTRIDENGHEVPDRKLHLNDSHSNQNEWFYEYAQPHHKSWAEKHGAGDPLPLQPLPDGEQHPAELYDTHPLFEQRLQEITSSNPKRGR